MYPREYEFPVFNFKSGQQQRSGVAFYLTGLKDAGVVDSFAISHNRDATYHVRVMIRSDSSAVEDNIKKRFKDSFNGKWLP